MTTLPQTTPLRLPRAGGQNQLAAPTQHAPAAAATPGYQMTMGDLWRILRANLWILILLVAAGGVSGFFLNGYLEKNYPVYRSKGIVQIFPIQSTDPLHPTVGFADVTSLGIQQQTQAQYIKAESTLDSVLEDPNGDVQKTDWFRITCGGDVKIALKNLTRSLTVTPQAGPQLIDVSMEAPTAHDSNTVLSAVVKKAIDDTTENNRSKTRVDYKDVKDRKDKNEAALRRATEDITRVESELIHDGADPGGGMSTRLTTYSKLYEEMLSLKEKKNSTTNALSSFDESVKNGVTPLAVKAALDDDRELTNQNSQVQLMDQEFQRIKEASGQDSPQYKNAEAELARMQDRYNKAKQVKQADLTKTYRDQMQAGASSFQQQYDDSVKAVEAYQKQNADMSNKVNLLNALREQRRIALDLDQQYEKRMNDLFDSINSVNMKTMDWFAPPREPDTRESPKLVTTMAGTIAVGLFLSLGIAFMRELTDTSVRSPRDIARVGQLNLLGMISHEQDDPQASGVRLPLVIFEAPHSIMAENLRDVRTKLQHTASLDTTRTLLITSPNPGDGKSTIAVNLAAGLALNGRRILLVDSNFRRPELHRIFGVGNDIGFSDALNDVNVFPTAVRETAVPNLSVMASGPKPSNPTELIESQLMLDFIERALEEYDHVIFDSGPMLFVSESVALAPRVDGVVTVVRARTSSRGVLTRMRDTLRAVKAEHLGVVLNGVRTQAGGYYAKNIQRYYKYQNAD